MKKSVKSTDPRKPQIVGALKKASGGTKVTSVKEIGLNRFEGHCMKIITFVNPHGYTIKSDKYESLGVFSITVEGV